jgi:hypothetical protein
MAEEVVLEKSLEVGRNHLDKVVEHRMWERSATAAEDPGADVKTEGNLATAVDTLAEAEPDRNVQNGS